LFKGRAQTKTLNENALRIIHKKSDCKSSVKFGGRECNQIIDGCAVSLNQICLFKKIKIRSRLNESGEFAEAHGFPNHRTATKEKHGAGDGLDVPLQCRREQYAHKLQDVGGIH
jgi:hypothetical protein